MRVLALVHHYGPGRSAGAEVHIHTMLAALVLAGHRVDVVLSRQAGAPYTYDGVNVWPTVDVKRDVWPHLYDADLLVTHLENTERATALGRLNQIPVAVVAHNTLRQTGEVLATPWARVDLLAVNSMHMAAHFAGRYAPQVVVRPIADPAVYATTPGDKVTLLNLRRADEPGGQSKGGELFRALAERLPDIPFLGVTGAYGTQEPLADLPNVEVVDHVPHDEVVERVYARTRVLLVPSSYESWGRVASEAMCSGIPVVAHPTPGLVEQLGPAGLFIDRDDVDGWAMAVAELVDHRPAWAARSALSLARADHLAHARPGDLAAWVEAAERTVANHRQEVTA